MKTLKKILKWLGVVVLALAAIGFTLYLIYVKPVMNKIMGPTETINYDKELTIIIGGGGNSGIITSDSLVIVVDTKVGDAAKALADTVAAIAGKRPVLIVNTHYHEDHAGGNKYFKGAQIVAGGNYTQEKWVKKTKDETLPTIWLKDKMDIKMGDDTITIINMNRNAHTESDVFVYSHKRKLLFGGDVILNKQVPALMDADLKGYLIALNELPKQFKIEKVVPGHGPMGGSEVLENFKQYFADMETAATDDSKKDELVAKYKDWTQVPLIMSPGVTISAFKKIKENK